MTVTMAEVSKLMEEISKFTGTEIKFSLALKLNRILDEIDIPYATYSKTRKELFEKYGDKDAEGNYIVPTEKIPEFTKEFETIQNEKIIIDNLEMIPSSLFDEALQIAPQDMRVLARFIQ